MALFIPQISTRFAGQCSRVFFTNVRYYGSSPEMPLVGSRGWQSMLKSFRAQQIQPPLSKTEVLNSQRLCTIESDMSVIKEMMAKVMESNKHMQQSLEKLQHKNIAPQQ